MVIRVEGGGAHQDSLDGEAATLFVARSEAVELLETLESGGGDAPMMLSCHESLGIMFEELTCSLHLWTSRRRLIHQQSIPVFAVS